MRYDRNDGDSDGSDVVDDDGSSASGDVSGLRFRARIKRLSDGIHILT